jgi:hypothetical protein
MIILIILILKKIYSENSNGDDGWELEITISRKNGFMKLIKKVEIFSPDNDKSETNKLLQIIEEIKELSKFDEFYSSIEKKIKYGPNFA